MRRSQAGPLPPASWARASNLRWTSAATLHLLLTDLEQAIASWSEGWGIGAATLRCADASDETPRRGAPGFPAWSHVPDPDQGKTIAWLRPDGCEDEPAAIVREALFGEGSGPLALDVAGDAWADLVASIAAALSKRCLDLRSGDDDRFEALAGLEMSWRWSGLARVRIDWGRAPMGAWWMLCRPRCAKGDVTRGPPSAVIVPLVRLEDVLAQRRMPASASLAAADLPIRSLVRMRCGDILGLPHRLDVPLRVRIGSGSRACLLDAGLVHAGRAKAILLIGRAALPVPSSSSNGGSMSQHKEDSTDAMSSAQPGVRWLDIPAAPGVSPHAPPLGLGLHPLLDVRARVEIRVGCFEVTVGELAAAPAGAVFALDRGLDDPVDVLVEGQVVARGQLVAVDDCFAVRLTELPPPLPLLAGTASDGQPGR